MSYNSLGLPLIIRNVLFCKIASISNLTLTQELRLKFLQYFTYKSFLGNWCFYLHARKGNMRSDVDGLTHTKQLQN